MRMICVATDTLSDVLKAVRLTGAAYFDIAAQEPWSVHSPARDVILPRILPGADRLIAYHVVTSGRCYAGLVGGEAVPLEAGEVVMFTNADPHVMSSSAGMRSAFCLIPRKPRPKGEWTSRRATQNSTNSTVSAEA